ncbi:hypothetical protein FB451DRAFT_1039742, partial [Mycena latifolia]
MTDINPRYVPRVLKALPLVANEANRPAKDKGKSKAPGILSFFGPAAKPKVPPLRVKMTSPKAVKGGMIVGKASGKRSLAAEMDRDIAAKRKRQEGAAPPATQSRFFAASPMKARAEADAPVAGPSRPDASKENVPIANAEEEDEGDDLDLGETDLDADLE